MSYKIIARITSAIIFISILATLLLAYKFHNGTKLAPLQCRAFSKDTVQSEKGNMKFTINKNLQLFENGNGILQFEGYVEINNVKSYLERTVYLSEEHYIGDYKYYFKIDRIMKSKLDNTNEYSFEQLWSEFSADNNILNVEIEPIYNGLSVVSGPYSPQFSCATY